MKLNYFQNQGADKYLENLCVKKFFDTALTEIVTNDIIDYCRNSKLKVSRYGRMKAAYSAIVRCGEDLDVSEFNNFRELVNYYIF